MVLLLLQLLEVELLLDFLLLFLLLVPFQLPPQVGLPLCSLSLLRFVFAQFFKLLFEFALLYLVHSLRLGRLGVACIASAVLQTSEHTDIVLICLNPELADVLALELGRWTQQRQRPRPVPRRVAARGGNDPPQILRIRNQT